MNDNKAPVADLFAIVPTGRKKDSGESINAWVPIAALWENRDESLAGEQYAIPRAWQSPRVPRRVQVRHRGDHHEGVTGQRDESNKKPTAELIAILPPATEGGKDRWQRLCALWVNDDGSLSGEMLVVPLLWANPQVTPRFQVRYLDDRHDLARERNPRNEGDDGGSYGDDDIPF